MNLAQHCIGCWQFTMDSKCRLDCEIGVGRFHQNNRIQFRGQRFQAAGLHVAGREEKQMNYQKFTNLPISNNRWWHQGAFPAPQWQTRLTVTKCLRNPAWAKSSPQAAVGKKKPQDQVHRALFPGVETRPTTSWHHFLLFRFSAESESRKLESMSNSFTPCEFFRENCSHANFAAIFFELLHADFSHTFVWILSPIVDKRKMQQLFEVNSCTDIPSTETTLSSFNRDFIYTSQCLMLKHIYWYLT